MLFFTIIIVRCNQKEHCGQQKKHKKATNKELKHKLNYFFLCCDEAFTGIYLYECVCELVFSVFVYLPIKDPH